MLNRRAFVSGSLAGSFALPALLPGRAALTAALRRAEDAGGEEDYWSEIQRAYTVDRAIVNLNNGGVSPAPAIAQEAMKRHLDFSNEAPPYTMWRVLEPQREIVREELAREWGVDPEEIAITRNATEGLHILQMGMDLAPGDEVLTTNQDYPRMRAAFRQRARREGIVLKEISIPVPAEDPDEVVRLFEQAITPRTKLLLCCHVINLTGQVLPVRAIAAMAREHGVRTIVDGAHALAHLDFRLSDLDCDFYATSLHKWLCAPHGTGLLYVRRERIPDVWPLMPADEVLDDDVRKFEQIGTHPAANTLAISESLLFHQGIGSTRKLARLVHLRDYWAHRLLENDRVHLHTSLEPGLAGGIANVWLEDVDSGELSSWLWKEHRILVTPIKHDEFEGVRISPNVYTTHEELDRFCDAVEAVLRDGLPA